MCNAGYQRFANQCVSQSTQQATSPIYPPSDSGYSGQQAPAVGTPNHVYQSLTTSPYATLMVYTLRLFVPPPPASQARTFLQAVVQTGAFQFNSGTSFTTGPGVVAACSSAVYAPTLRRGTCSVIWTPRCLWHPAPTSPWSTACSPTTARPTSASAPRPH